MGAAKTAKRAKRYRSLLIALILVFTVMPLADAGVLPAALDGVLGNLFLFALVLSGLYAASGQRRTLAVGAAVATLTILERVIHPFY